MPEIAVTAVFNDYQGAPLKTRAGKPYFRVSDGEHYYNVWPTAGLVPGCTLSYQETFGEGKTKWLKGTSVAPTPAAAGPGEATLPTAAAVTQRDQTIVRQNCQHQGALIATAAASLATPGTKKYQEAVGYMAAATRVIAYSLESTYVFREVKDYPPLTVEVEEAGEDAPPHPDDAFPAE